MFFHLVMSVGQKKKKKSAHEELKLRPLDSLPLSHRDSVVGEVYYKVHMTCVLHTARIGNADSVMFVDRIGEMVSFKLKTCHLSYYYPQIYMYSLPKNGEIALNSTKLRHKDHWIIV